MVLGKDSGHIGTDHQIRYGPEGIHHFWRETGTNVLFDEIQVARYRWSTAPRHVSIALTNACDLACPYCYAARDTKAIPFDRLAAWLLELDQNGCLGVGFGGGEPTLYFKLIDICRFATAITSLAVTLTTHGHRIDEEMSMQLSGNVNFCRVSMDGIGRTYEANRNRPFMDLTAKLPLIRCIAPFGINVVVDRDTVGQLDEICELANKYGASQLLLLPKRPTPNDPGIDPKSMESLRVWISENSNSIALAISEESAEGLAVADPYGTIDNQADIPRCRR